jgi:hypothetical protein
MDNDTAKTDFTECFLYHHWGGLFYFQISANSEQIQRNFDVCAVFSDQHPVSFVKLKKELSREKQQLIDFYAH